MLINQLTLTLYWKRNASWWYSSTLLEKCWLMFLILFENLIDNFKNILIRQFEDFLVDKEIQFQNTPNFRSDSFRFSLDIYSPLQFNATFRCTEACCCISQCVKPSHMKDSTIYWLNLIFSMSKLCKSSLPFEENSIFSMSELCLVFHRVHSFSFSSCDDDNNFNTIQVENILLGQYFLKMKHQHQRYLIIINP